jgi:triacylglycerol esterase/lipase EstA (alpha/beta hydrolase family)
MGGLDARRMLADPDLFDARRVAALVTLCTPHRGSPVADLITGILRRREVAKFRKAWSGLPPAAARLAQRHRLDVGKLPAWAGWIAEDRDAIANLTTERCAAFDRDTHNPAGVRCFWVAGDCAEGVPLLLKTTHEIVRRADSAAGGANDGLVALTSARPAEQTANPWTPLGVWPVDHLKAVNHCLPGDGSPDVTPRYLELLDQLEARGVPMPLNR